MNTELRKKAKKGFEKYFFKLMNNALFGKTTENLKNYRDVKLVPNCHTTNSFSENLLAIEMKKRKKTTKKQILMNKLAYFGHQN